MKMSILQVAYAKEIVSSLALTARKHPTSTAQIQIDTLLDNLLSSGVSQAQVEDIRATTILAQVTTII